MSTPRDFDLVAASRDRWVANGWDDAAAGMTAVVSVMRAEQVFQRRAADLLRPLDLTFARYQVLGMLRWTGPLTLGVIGRRLGIRPATVTSAVDRLTAAGLATRTTHPDDARATLLEITAKGRRRFDRAVGALNDQLFRATGLSDAEAATLVDLLARIRPTPD